MSEVNDYTITLTTTALASGVVVYTPFSGLTPVLKAQPSETITHTGTEMGSGVYLFQNVDDGSYKLYESNVGAEITKWGGQYGKWIGDALLEVYALTGGNNIYSGTNTFSGNTRLYTISEANSGSGAKLLEARVRNAAEISRR